MPPSILSDSKKKIQVDILRTWKKKETPGREKGNNRGDQSVWK